MTQLTAAERAEMWVELTELVRGWLAERVTQDLDQTAVVLAIAEAARQALNSARFHCSPPGEPTVQAWLRFEALPELRN